MPNQLSVHDRMPFEIAIEIVETALSENSKAVMRTLIEAQARSHGNDVRVYLDHALQVMIHNGYIRRCHLPQGCLAYEKTPSWGNRNEALLPLRAPRYVKRIRPRSREAMECKRLGLPFPAPQPKQPQGAKQSSETKQSAQAGRRFEQLLLLG